MTLSPAIDLSKVPLPDIVEVVDYKKRRDELFDLLQALDPGYALLLESDPIVKELEIVAYAVMNTRQRVNDASKANMLSSTRGNDLDNIMAPLFGLTRHVLVEADDTVYPPVREVRESDVDFKRRIQLAPESLAQAGSRGAYISHSLNCDPRVQGAQASRGGPGQVMVAILSRESGPGTASTDLLNVVGAYLRVRSPLTDDVLVQSAAILNYVVQALITVAPGPDKEVVRASAVTAARAYVDECHVIGVPVRRAGLIAALKQENVENVILTLPTADVVPDELAVTYCTQLQVTAQQIKSSYLVNSTGA